MKIVKEEENSKKNENIELVYNQFKNLETNISEEIFLKIKNKHIEIKNKISKEYKIKLNNLVGQYIFILKNQKIPKFTRATEINNENLIQILNCLKSELIDENKNYFKNLKNKISSAKTKIINYKYIYIKTFFKQKFDENEKLCKLCNEQIIDKYDKFFEALLKHCSKLNNDNFILSFNNDNNFAEIFTKLHTEREIILKGINVNIGEKITQMLNKLNEYILKRFFRTLMKKYKSIKKQKNSKEKQFKQIIEVREYIKKNNKGNKFNKWLNNTELICYPVGLENLGNTCFMNSCIQCLKHCYQFSNYIINKYEPDEANSKISYHFKKLLQNLFIPQKYTNASDFKRAIGNEIPIYQGYNQEDPSHFYLHLINSINDEMISSNKLEDNNYGNNSENEKNSSSSYSSSEERGKNGNDIYEVILDKNNFNLLNEKKQIPKNIEEKYHYFDNNKNTIKELFNGFLVNEIEYRCHHHIIKQSINSYIYLNLKINDDFRNFQNLEECFNNYIGEVTMDGNNKLFCSKCKKEVEGISRIKITTSPEILVINLKRVEGGKYLEHFVDYPLNLDLSNYICGDNLISKKYTLRAIIEHYGDNNGGHKVAVCKNFTNNKWYRFSDILFEEINVREIFSNRAHMFFYERCNVKTSSEEDNNLIKVMNNNNNVINEDYLLKAQNNSNNNKTIENKKILIKRKKNITIVSLIFISVLIIILVVFLKYIC